MAEMFSFFICKGQGTLSLAGVGSAHGKAVLRQANDSLRSTIAERQFMDEVQKIKTTKNFFPKIRINKIKNSARLTSGIKCIAYKLISNWDLPDEFSSNVDKG